MRKGRTLVSPQSKLDFPNIKFYTVKVFDINRQFVCIESRVLMLDGNLDIGAHVWSNLCYFDLFKACN